MGKKEALIIGAVLAVIGFVVWRRSLSKADSATAADVVSKLGGIVRTPASVSDPVGNRATLEKAIWKLLCVNYLNTDYTGRNNPNNPNTIFPEVRTADSIALENIGKENKTLCEAIKQRIIAREGYSGLFS